jgi:hypothetical protein
LRTKFEFTRRKEHLLTLTITLVPKWSGSESAIPLEKALEIIKGTVKRVWWHPTVALKLGISKVADAASSPFKSCPIFRKEKMWKKLNATLRVRSKAASQYYECQSIGHLAMELPAQRRQGRTRDSPGKGNQIERSRSDAMSNPRHYTLVCYRRLRKSKF